MILPDGCQGFARRRAPQIRRCTCGVILSIHGKACDKCRPAYILARKRRYYKSHRVKMIASVMRYEAKNRDKIRAKHRARRQDPAVRERERIARKAARMAANFDRRLEAA